MLLILGLLLSSSSGTMGCCKSQAIYGPFLPAPSEKLTEDQFNRLPVDIAEFMHRREKQWRAVYQDYLQRR